MKVIRNNTHWIIALFGGVCLVAAAAGMAQRQSVPATALAKSHDFSTVFRQVSRNALPSIVSIETRGKTIRSNQGLNTPSDEDFGDLLKRHPQFRDFFRQMPDQQPRRSRGMGSGFIIDPAGIIMTNSHVVRDAEEVTVRLHDGREFVATDVKTDPRSDVAIVRFKAPKNLQAIPLGNSDLMEIGDWVLAVGSPFGLDLTVTSGIISAKGRGPGIAERENFLQTDAAINPGNSGGPLLNLDGEVIGINTAISSHSGGSNGVGFTIPINMAKWVSQQLATHGAVRRAYLGVGIQPVDGKLARQFKTNVGEGAIVSRVLPGSPAADAKLQTGDVILKLNGKSVTSTRNLQGIVEQLQIGKPYTMTILRDGKRRDIKITVREMPNDLTTARRDRSPQDSKSPPTDNFEDLGIEVKALTAGVARQLGLEAASGVLVSAVKADSPADLAGIRTGTVIEKVGSKKVSSPDDFRAAMKDASLTDGIVLLVRTRFGTQFVVVQDDR